MVQIVCKSFKIKILTSNPYALKILQTIFCRARASQGFQRGWGEGVPFNSENLLCSEEPVGSA